MRMKFYSVLVQRAVTEVIPVDIMAHELPIVKAVHVKAGPEVVQVQSQFHRELPAINVRGEYERLAATYGKEPETGRLFVEIVYGRPETGQLARAMGLPVDGGLMDDMPEVPEREETPAQTLRAKPKAKRSEAAATAPAA